MIPWIQVYSNILTHDKTYSLAEELKIPNYAAVGIMVSLWAWASINATDGDISNYPPRAIAEATGWQKKPKDFYDILLRIRLIEKTEDGRTVIRNWENYALLLMDLMDSQKKKTNERVKRHRERKRQKEAQKEAEAETPTAHDGNADGNGNCNVTDTQSNALPNPTIPNPTIPNLSSYEDIIKLFGDDGGSRACGGAEIVAKYLEEHNLCMEQYFGATPEIKAKAQEIAETIFKRFALRAPTEQDVFRVFIAIRDSHQTPTNEWEISFPTDRIELLCYAFDQATTAGCAGNWRYIDGCLGRLAQRGIQTLEEAEDYDFEREREGS